MTMTRLNGVNISWQESGGRGEPLVLVHGSWGDHHNWDPVVPELSRSFRVITYDRRGHSLSERPATQGSINEDVDDLAALIEQLNLAPAHIAGNSGGAAIVLRLAGRRPELFRTLIAHEPPLFALLADDAAASAGLAEADRRIHAVLEHLQRGEDEEGARLFVETIAFGSGAWEQLPAETRRTFVFNAPTFLDESRDPDALTLDLASLRGFPARALLTHGTNSAPFFPLAVKRIAAALPHARVEILEGAGHVPHLTHPADYVERARSFIGRS